MDGLLLVQLYVIPAPSHMWNYYKSKCNNDIYLQIRWCKTKRLQKFACEKFAPSLFL